MRTTIKPYDDMMLKTVARVRHQTCNWATTMQRRQLGTVNLGLFDSADLNLRPIV